MKRLAEGYGVEPGVTYLLDNCDVYIVRHCLLRVVWIFVYQPPPPPFNFLFGLIHFHTLIRICHPGANC